MATTDLPAYSPFQDLIVWQRSMVLATQVCQLTRNTPARFRFNLAEQMHRSAISIPSNIAEGAGRLSRGEFRQHVGIARGSLRELETQLLLGVRVDAFSQADIAEPLLVAAEVGRMLSKLSSSLR
jgi:four helix bundle protein